MENLNIIFDIANTLKNKNKIDELFLLNEYVSYEKSTLGTGYLGISMLFAELNYRYPNEEWDIYSDMYLKDIIEEINKNGFYSLSLFAGASGVGFVTYCLSKLNPKYLPIHNKIYKYISKNLELFLNTLNINDVKPFDYDIIEGIAGIINYYLNINDRESTHEIKLILQKLIQYGSFTEIQGISMPKMYIPAKNQLTEIEKSMLQNGSINLGLAHGIIGIVIVLSLCKLKDISIPYQVETITNLIEFIDCNKINHDDNFFWIANLPIEQININNDSKILDNINMFRDAWCYGVPGIALSFLYAGLALERDDLLNKAKLYLSQSIDRCLGVNEGIICHGYAGILLILLKFKHELNTLEYDEAIIIFKEHILKLYNKEYILGYKTFYNHKDINAVGLLDGIAGICLSLLEVEEKSLMDWTKIFMV